MIKKEVLKTITTKNRVTKEQTKKAVESAFEEIKKQLHKDLETNKAQAKLGINEEGRTGIIIEYH